MCFGSKDNTNEPAPRPAQVQPSSNNTAQQKASMPQDYAPPPGPPPSHGQRQYHQPQPQAQSNYYAPPPGPPPSQSYSQDYVPPPGPPPSQSYSQDYAPPPGPPPSDTKNNPFFNNPGPQNAEYAPPPGPPPSHGQSKQHDWQTAVPDTALLPPPPNFFSGFDRSPANNASEEECEAGEAWCRQYPLYAPMPPNQDAAAALHHGNIAVYAPPFFTNSGRGTLTQTGTGTWRVASQKGASDTCLATYPPLYHAAAHSPLATGRAKTAYFEVRILQQGGTRGDEVSLALGFAAPPYPAFRLPGWHRASLAVHGDDGHKYVNDRWGGKAFTAPFRRGETVGLGMRFKPATFGVAGGGITVEVFLTRDGREVGGWNLHEETDRDQDLPVTGLEGEHDLCAAVGCFDKVAFEVVFRREEWLWRGFDG
ncbi:hypothetical protein F4677DRAFT_426693 [Hypoxylon crocopeplum]|nr:hypothetical protein F4677DRAFT_426693 [Hypoxylon crocopeplum]